jgi:trk system potassium uptake protein TrkH
VILMSVEPLSFTDSSFEAFSALGTVGLSHDVTPTLNSAGKFLIIALMFTGRVLFPTLVIRLVRSRRESPDPVEWV